MQAIVQDGTARADVLRLARIARPEIADGTRCCCACTQPASTGAPGT